ncbi:hypothetical protein [Nocardia sp. NPDC051570]|uniref:hypothetical protein n=1 Tax=Nocardia sp. NPDC051570 TaxID=3364324 RepID=UPI00379A76E5
MSSRDPGPFDDELPLLRAGSDPVGDEEEEHGSARVDPPLPPELDDEFDDERDEFDKADEHGRSEDEGQAAAGESGGWQQWLGTTDAVRKSSTWDDDGDYDENAPALVDRSGGRHITVRRRRRRRNRDAKDGERRSGSKVMLSVMIGVGVAFIAGVVVVNFVMPHHRIIAARPTQAAATGPLTPAGSSTPVSAPPTTAAEVATVATAGCEQSSGVDTASGTGPGNTDTAADAIMAFEHAYYAQRSGVAVRAVVAPDASVPQTAKIQAGIDQLPAALRYCVKVSKVPAGGGALWAVTLTEQWPDEAAPVVYHQTVTTSHLGGRYLISAVSEA